MQRKIKLFTVFVVVFLTLGCGQFEFGVENSPVHSSPTATPGVEGEDPFRSEPPSLMDVEPMEEPAAPSSSSPEIRLGLDCSNFDLDPLIKTACNIQDSFISRNTMTLLSYMPAEFILAYWQSEGTTVSPEYALEYFQKSLLPPNPLEMTFTTDRTEFPPLFGTPPELMFGPDMQIATIIYSEGWGRDGEGAVLIYITGDAVSGYEFPAIVVAPSHFDKTD